MGSASPFAPEARTRKASAAKWRITYILTQKMSVTPPKNLTELFLGFLSIGARSFGGVMPWAYRVMVEERRWITAADFTETVGLCQFLPAPNIGNTSVCPGSRWSALRRPTARSCGLCHLPFARGA